MGGPGRGCKWGQDQEKLRIWVQILRRSATNHGILSQSQEDWSRPAMNASSEMNFEDMLRVKLEVLRREHRDMDAAIHALEQTGRPDVLTLRRL